MVKYYNVLSMLLKTYFYLEGLSSTSFIIQYFDE